MSFLFLVFVALIAFGVNLLFSRIATESYTSDELYSKLTDGRIEVRRMAASEWARQLLDSSSKTHVPPNEERTTRMGGILIQSLESSIAPDEIYLSSIATLLGFSTKAELSKNFLSQYLSLARDKNLQRDSQIYALISLGRLGALTFDEASLMESYSRHANPDLRKTVAFAMGSLPTLHESNLNVLVKLISDPVEDVRWNAAISLTRHGKIEGIQLAQLLLQGAIQKKAAEITIKDFQLYKELMKSARISQSPILKELIQEMANQHPNVKLRQAAKELQY